MRALLCLGLSLLVIPAVATAATDTMRPIVNISAPAQDALVEPSFTVTASITDDVGVAKAELYVDDVLVDTRTSEPWTWTTGPMLAVGMHTIVLKAWDAANNEGVAITNVTHAGEPSECPTGECSEPTLCNAGGGSGFALLLGVGVAIALGRRRQRPNVARRMN
jgi:hypothetical protein